jgi:hypothetical protein
LLIKDYFLSLPVPMAGLKSSIFECFTIVLLVYNQLKYT